MLGKLMKYEWKNTWKAGMLMLLGIFIVTVAGCIVLQMPGGVVSNLVDGNEANAAQTWLVISSFTATLILYVIMLLASTWGMLIFLGIRFYRSMYTDEGYLSHTLPVTANQLFLSKVLVSGVWYLFIMIGIGISIVALLVSLMMGLMDISELSGVLTQYNGNVWEFLGDGILYYHDHPVRSTDHRTAFLQTQGTDRNPRLCGSYDPVVHYRKYGTECIYVQYEYRKQRRRNRHYHQLDI